MPGSLLHCVKLAYKCCFSILLLFYFQQIYTHSSLSTSKKSFYSRQQTSILNTFPGCNIPLIYFRGIDIDFHVLNASIILRYISLYNSIRLFPIELLSANPVIKIYNLSFCQSVKTDKANLPSEK